MELEDIKSFSNNSDSQLFFDYESIPINNSFAFKKILEENAL